MKLVDEKGHGFMTEDLRRLFISEDCDPACHACRKKIPVGEKFALVESARELDENDHETVVETMVCWVCRAVNLPERERRRAAALLGHERRAMRLSYGVRHGCFVVNGKIIAS